MSFVTMMEGHLAGETNRFWIMLTSRWNRDRELV